MWHALNQSIDKFYYTKSTQYESTEIVKYRINKILEEKSWENLSNTQIFEELQKESQKIITKD